MLPWAQVSRLIHNPATPDKVRSWGARFLNLTLTHLAPALVEAAAAEGDSSGAAGSGEAAAEGSGDDDGVPEASRPTVVQSLEAARQGVEEVLGADAAALLMRKVSLSEHQAESKLEQLGQALSFFLPQQE